MKGIIEHLEHALSIAGHFVVNKIAYFVALLGYVVTLPYNFEKYDTIIDNSLKFIFGLLLFFITYFAKHYLDKRLKK